MRLLSHITETQRWGIPAVRRRRLEGLLQGRLAPGRDTEGTTGAVTHQAALLVHRSGRERLALAVLTDEAPGTGGGYDGDRGGHQPAAGRAAARRCGWPAP